MKDLFYHKNDFAPEKLAEVLWGISQEAYEFGAPWKSGQFLGDLKNERSEYILLADEKEIIGFAGYSWVLDEAEITNIAVRTASKNQGAGEKILAQLILEAKSKGVAQIFLEVRKSNQPAVKLYEKLGFTPAGIRKAYYAHPSEDGLILSLKVRNEDVRNVE